LLEGTRKVDQAQSHNPRKLGEMSSARCSLIEFIYPLLLPGREVPLVEPETG
jgi:hypothetical protein